MTFEQAISRLDEIVTHLGDGSVALDESLKLYSEGAKLIKDCSDKLSSAKLKIEKLQISQEVQEDEL